MSAHTSQFKSTDTVGDIVARRPVLSRVFGEAGIDFCCGGKKSLEEACRKKGIDTTTLLAALEEAAASDEKPVVDVLAMSPPELANHIEQVHHAYLKSELPRLGMLTEKVARVHGGEDPRLVQVNETFQVFLRKQIEHTITEEETVFPRIKAGETSTELADALRKLESEHDMAGMALARFRELTDGYAPPIWACNSYRAMLDGLARLEHDMHQHVHKENHVLFPRAVGGDVACH